MGDEEQPKVVLQACTPEQRDKWARLAETRPARAVAVLKLGLTERTPQGDTPADIVPALIAVRTIACGLPRAGGDTGRKVHPAWKSLVDAGIVQALCDVVRIGKMGVPADAALGIAQEALDAAAQGLPSPYFEPLTALAQAVQLIAPEKHTSADRKLLTTLRRKWKDMMQRVWEDPANTLVQEDDRGIHRVDRGLVARIVRRLSVVDPAFLSIVYDPEDLTIPVIARAWAHTTGGSDCWETTDTIQQLLFPAHPKTVEYVSTHPIPPLNDLLQRVYMGCSPPGTFTPTAHGKAFIAAVTRAAKDEDIECAQRVPNFLMLVLEAMAEDEDCGREIALAMQQSRPLWEAFFDLIRRGAVQGAGSGKTVGWPAVLGLMANTLGALSTAWPREMEPLIRLWADAGFWDVLQERVSAIATQPGMTMLLVRMFMLMDDVAQKSTPGLREALRRQFPRAVVVGTLCRNDAARQGTGSRPHAVRGTGMQFARDHAWDQMAWQLLAKLQFTCRREGECGRRGCLEDARADEAKCGMCKKATYCGTQCMEADKTEHQLVCGWVGLLERCEF